MRSRAAPPERQGSVLASLGHGVDHCDRLRHISAIIEGDEETMD
ncbi:hypothetical protein [Aminobacter sp. HY435]|nr:hypothetical protein [Aminobacter sp. HY435]